MKIRNPLTAHEADKAYDTMYELFLHDNFAAANKEGHKILQKFPEHEATLLLLGQIATIKKQRSAARERYNKILEKDTGNSKALLGRADASFGKKRYEAALQDYLSLYESSWKNFPYMTKLAASYAALKLDRIALTYYSKAVQILDRDLEAHFACIRHCIKLRHYKDAEQKLQTAKDIYYSHKGDYTEKQFAEINGLEKLIGKYIHRGTKKSSKASDE